MLWECNGCSHWPSSLFERNDSLATSVVTCGPNAVLSIFGVIRHALDTFLVRLWLPTLCPAFTMFSLILYQITDYDLVAFP